MKSLLITSLLFAFLISFNLGAANNCSSAQTISPDSTYTLSFDAENYTEYWASFSPSTVNSELIISSDSTNLIDSIKIYSGSCGSLVLEKTVYDSEYDAQHSISLINYYTSTTYYVQLFCSSGNIF